MAKSFRKFRLADLAYIVLLLSKLKVAYIVTWEGINEMYTYYINLSDDFVDLRYVAPTTISECKYNPYTSLPDHVAVV